jgi:hypothetical protein
MAARGPWRLFRGERTGVRHEREMYIGERLEILYLFLISHDIHIIILLLVK